MTITRIYLLSRVDYLEEVSWHFKHLFSNAYLITYNAPFAKVLFLLEESTRGTLMRDDFPERDVLIGHF